MSTTPVIDAETRLRALDTNVSVAVQAPAGSGKTELLSLRFLKLLAKCSQPEEILAITFTRKAAAEMTSRIIETLEWAAAGDANLDQNTDLDKLKFELASQVLAQDKALGWQLLQAPDQLRIQTIDSFCHHLARNLPVLANFGNSPQISDQVEECYQEAVSNTLELLNSDSPIAEAVGKLLSHLDNKVTQVESLLIGLLRQRDQWSAAILEVAGSPRQAYDYLQQNLTEMITESLQQSTAGLLDFENPLLELLNFAAENLLAENSSSAITHCAELSALPPADHQALSQWRGLAEFLLVADRDKPAWRKRINKAQGFPVPSSAKDKDEAVGYKQVKVAMESLLQTLGKEQGLLESLDYIRRLPDPDREIEQWQFLITLTSILPTLLAQLNLAFARHNKVDHSQVSSAALEALGETSAPTDLTLALDYRIQHILVDEFQDTSSTQLTLLKKLTAGWESEDQRTLFIVGDAMQSCYGFRSANVGLFIAAREYGIGEVPLLALNLETNFRSTSSVVAWVNSVFSAAFPPISDISRGAIDYSTSTAFHTHPLESAISTQVFLYEGSESELAYQEEARHVAGKITSLRQSHPADSVAILVRNRTHLRYILPELRAANIPWQATDIDKLAALPVIIDLTSLVRALSNLANRLAWLSILRAPWCGLDSEDLHTIALHAESNSIWHTLTQADQLSGLKQGSRSRIEPFVTVMAYALQHLLHNNLSHVAQVCWETLQGRSLYPSTLELKSAERFFELVAEQEVAGTLTDMERFEQRIDQVTISGDTQALTDNPISIMTVHKAKGLEFDHVIVPGLARTGRADTKSLLLWHERLNYRGLPRLFLATLSATGNDDGALYQLIRHEKSLKDRLENTRLLYIAVTRARKTASLMASLQQKEDELAAPGSRSLLATIWPALHNSEQAEIEYIRINAEGAEQPSTAQVPNYQAARIRRLKAPPSRFTSVAEPESTLPKELNTEPTSREARLSAEIGNLVHRSLQNHVIHGPDANFEQTRQVWKKQLFRSGYSQKEIKTALTITENSVKLSIATTDFNWIFNNSLQSSQTEIAINTLNNGYLQTHVIDRTFIDTENIRWIIDYKSAQAPADQSLETFISLQIELHSPQLARYRALYEQMEGRQIKTALLLTSIPRLVEVELPN